jgi:hypothetical protein
LAQDIASSIPNALRESKDKPIATRHRTLARAMERIPGDLIVVDSNNEPPPLFFSCYFK